MAVSQDSRHAHTQTNFATGVRMSDIRRCTPQSSPLVTPHLCPYAHAMPSNPPRIAILLASRNGGAFIDAQLASLARQDYPHWRLVVSDDGSNDGTREAVQRFAERQPGREISLIDGPRAGATRNFLSLISAVQPGEALAFCDQDDVWLPDRLSRGAQALFAHGNRGPSLHVTRTTICDEALNPLRPAPLYRRAPSFRNALVQACTPGNTMLVNPAGAELLNAGAAAAAAASIISHDWWSYQLIAGAGGRVIRDPAQTVLYRQHPDNVMGRNDTLRARIARLRGLGGGEYGSWLRANTEALSRAAALLTPDNRALLRHFAAALGASGPVAAAAFVRLGLYRQTRAGTAALLAAATAGRLRAAEG